MKKRIEMFGFPGSGKSTTLNKVHKEYPEFQVRQANTKANIRNILSLLWFVLLHPKILNNFKFLKNLPKNKKKAHFKTIIRFILRVMVMENELKQNKRILVDEGIVQITWSLLLLPAIYNDKFDAKLALNDVVKNWWPKSNFLICYIEVSDEEYIRRIGTRERMHYFSKEFKDNNSLYKNKGKEILNLIFNKARDLYTITVYK